MEASDKDGLSRGDDAVLWPPNDRTAWIDPARTAIVPYSERASREHLIYAAPAEQAPRVPLAYFGWFHGNPRGS